MKWHNLVVYALSAIHVGRRQSAAFVLSCPQVISCNLSLKCSFSHISLRILPYMIIGTSADASSQSIGDSYRIDRWHVLWDNK